MLPNFWHRDFAKKRALGNQERRLLCFAGTPDADATTPEEEEIDPLATQETFAGAGLNPDGTPIETPEQGAEGGVDGGVDETRGAVEGAMNNPEDAEESEKEAASFRGLDKKIADTQKKLRSIIDKKDDIRALIKSQTTGSDQKTHLEEFENAIVITEMAQNNLNDYERVVQSVTNFQSGALTPEMFLEDYSTGLQKDTSEIEGFDVASISSNLSAIESKQLSDLEKKMERDDVIEEILNQDQFQNVARFIGKQIETIEKSISTVTEYSSGLEKNKTDDKQPGMTWSSFWANTMSINDMINGTKKYIEAYKKSYEEWNQLKEARFAQKIGNGLSWIPLGKQTETVLNRQTESANDTVRDEHKQGLEALKPSFSQVVEMIDKTKDANPNHFRALLEYAADRAWLYDYDAINGTAFGIQIKNYLPHTWKPANREEYLRELDNKNGSGEETEKTRGYGRVETIDSIPPLIDILHDELNRGNYWAAHGILKRGMEKGKEGETSTWISATIFRYLRDNPTARKHFPITLLDDLGNIGISHPAWTTTWFKIDRDTIVAWQKTDAKDGPGGLEGSGNLGEVIQVAEEHILSEIPSLSNDTRTLDRYVAQILAGQTLLARGKKFTIFDERYDAFRSAMNLAPTSIDPKQADDDFFNAVHNRGSEMILLGKEAFKGILGIQSTGEFFEPVKSGMFLKQLALREEDLKKEFGVDAMEYKTYLREMSSKMNEWLISNANDSRSAAKLGNTKFPAEDDYVLLTYLEKGLINIQTLLKLDTTATSLGPIVIRQMFDSPSPAVSREEVMRIATENRDQNRMTEAGFKVIEGICYPGQGVQRPANRGSDQPSASSPTTQAA